MYSVVQCVNGSYSVVAEGLSESSAKINFWDRCIVLENAPDVLLGQIAILNQQLQIYGGYTEQIIHEVPEPTPEEQRFADSTTI